MKPALQTVPSVTVGSNTGTRPWWAFIGDDIPGVGSYETNVQGTNVILSSTDIDVPNADVPLVFARTYNSASKYSLSNTDGQGVGLYGNAWTNTLDAHVAFNNVGGISIFDGQGSQFDYSINAQGQFVPPSGEYSTLVYDGLCELQWTQPSGIMYQFYWPDITQCPASSETPPATSIALDGRLIQIVGRNSNAFVSLAYTFDKNNASASTNLNTVAATSQAEQSITLSFSTDSAGHRLLSSATAPDGTTTYYGFDADENLIEIDLPPNNLSLTTCNLNNPCRPETISYGEPGHALSEVATPAWHDWTTVQGGWLHFEWGASSVSQIEYYGNVNPTIPDGNSTGPLQPNAPATSWKSLYRTVALTYNTVGSGGSTTWSDTDNHNGSFSYDSAGRITQVAQSTSDGSGAILAATLTWNTSTNELSQLSESSGTNPALVTNFGYNSSGDLIAVAQPSTLTSASPNPLRPTSYADYDSFHNVIAYCDPVLVDGRGQNWNGSSPISSTVCVGKGVAANASWQASYNYLDSNEPYGELTETLSSLGKQVNFSYIPSASELNDLGLPTSITQPSFTQTPAAFGTYAASTVVSYDPAGDVLSVNNGEGTTNYSYDSQNRLLVATDPDSVSAYTTYYGNGQVHTTANSLEHAAGKPHTYTYDANEELGSVTETINNAAATTDYYMDGASRLVEVKQPYDSSDYFSTPPITQYYYDLSQGGTVSVSAPSGSAFGGVYALLRGSSAGPQVFREFRYDGLDRMTSRFDPVITPQSSPQPPITWVSTYLQYDTGNNLGLPSLMTRSDGSIVSYAYNALGELSAVTHSKETGVFTPSKQLLYNERGQLASASLGSHKAATLWYDSDGELSKYEEPSDLPGSATYGYSYYPSGLLASANISSTSLGSPLNYYYGYRRDGLMSNTKMSYATAQDEEFAWTYTSGGRPHLGSDPVNANAQRESYSGEVLSSLAIPAGIYYYTSYDLSARLLSYYGFNQPSSDPVTMKYNNRGELTGESYLGNAITSATSADGLLLPTNLGGTFGPLFDQRNLVPIATYGGSACNNLNGTNESWSYDTLNREVAATINRVGIAGGTCSITSEEQIRKYDGDDHLISYTDSVPGTNGTAISASYTWGPLGQLQQDTYDGGNAATLHWDPFGQLIFTNTGSGVSDVNDIKVGISADYLVGMSYTTPSGSPGTFTGMIVQDRDASGLAASWHGQGGLTSQWLTPRSGNQLSYAPGMNNFSLSLSIVEPGLDSYSDGLNQFQGRRVYDQSMGTWTTPDAVAGALGSPASLNAFEYKNDNSLAGLDSTGEFVEDPPVLQGPVDDPGDDPGSMSIFWGGYGGGPAQPAPFVPNIPLKTIAHIRSRSKTPLVGPLVPPVIGSSRGRRKKCDGIVTESVSGGEGAVLGGTFTETATGYLYVSPSVGVGLTTGLTLGDGVGSVYPNAGKSVNDVLGGGSGSFEAGFFVGGLYSINASGSAETVGLMTPNLFAGGSFGFPPIPLRRLFPAFHLSGC